MPNGAPSHDLIVGFSSVPAIMRAGAWSRPNLVQRRQSVRALIHPSCRRLDAAHARSM